MWSQLPSKLSVNNLMVFFLTMLMASAIQADSAKAKEQVILVSAFNQLSKGAAITDLQDDWEVKVWAGVPNVKMVKDGGIQALRLRSQQSSIAVNKELSVDLTSHAHLSWEWKVTALPRHADARDGSRDDQAAGLYVIFPRFPAFLNSRILGYIWDTTAPVGTVLQSQNNHQVYYIVVRNGQEELAKWKHESRDVLADYTRIFGEVPPMVGGVSLMIDTDHTASKAESFFGNIRFHDQIGHRSTYKKG